MQRIDRLNIWKQGGRRAHGGGEKIFCSRILYALGRCLRGEYRLMPYAEVDRLCKLACSGGLQGILQIQRIMGFLRLSGFLSSTKLHEFPRSNS